MHAPPPHLDTQTLRALAHISHALRAAANAVLYCVFAPRNAAQLALYVRTANPKLRSPLACEYTLAGPVSPMSPLSMTHPTYAEDTSKQTARLVLVLVRPPLPSLTSSHRGPGALAALRARERFVDAARDVLFPSASKEDLETGLELSQVLTHLRTLLVDAELLDALASLHSRIRP